MLPMGPSSSRWLARKRTMSACVTMRTSVPAASTMGTLWAPSDSFCSSVNGEYSV
jgi:hypothetical protein